MERSTAPWPRWCCPSSALAGEPQLEWPSNGGGTHSEYRAGAMNMDGASFALTLGFLDGLLNSFTFTCDAQEGEDLSPLYEDLRSQLGSLYGLPEEESVLEDVLAPAQEERGKDLLYDIQRFSSWWRRKGSGPPGFPCPCWNWTALAFSWSLPWACTSEHFSRENTKKAPHRRCFFFVLGCFPHREGGPLKVRAQITKTPRQEMPGVRVCLQERVRRCC